MLTNSTDQTQQTIVRWEYNVIHIRPGRAKGMFGSGGVQDQLNQMGRDGWELCASHGESLFFKRPA